MRERRQTAPAIFLTKKQVGLFLDTVLPPVVFPYIFSRKEITTVSQHRQALPGNVVDSDAKSGRFRASHLNDWKSRVSAKCIYDHYSDSGFVS